MLSQRKELSGVVSVRRKGVTVERQELLAEKVKGAVRRLQYSSTVRDNNGLDVSFSDHQPTEQKP